MKNGTISLDNNGITQNTEKDQDESNIKIDYKLTKVRNATQFFTVEKCIQQFEDNSEFIAKEMECQYGEKIQQYKVMGIENINQKDNPLYYRVVLDTYNHTFEVTSFKNKDCNSLDEIDILDSIENINETGKNKFQYKRYTTEDICRKYLRYYKELELNDSKEAYKILDKEYREERFSGLEDFEKYIQDNKGLIERMALSEYSEPEIKEESTKYILKDQFNHYFIIEEESTMNFTIQLDEYTITSEDFKKKYMALKEAEKTSANIGIFIQMINSKDYAHAYKKLSNGFKDNYFKTQEDFEKYIKSNWFQNLGYEIINYKNEGNIYIYNLNLKNLEGRETETKEQKINIRLKEEDNADYEISFNI